MVLSKIGSQSAGWFPSPKGGGCYQYIRGIYGNHKCYGFDRYDPYIHE